MFSKLLLGAGLILSPAICLAQATPALYVGASASMLSTSPFRDYNANFFGPAVTVGYQLSPRWAIQSGASLIWDNYNSTSTYTGSPIYDRISYERKYTQLVVPLLARYTFTDPASPLHVDALFGGNWVHGMSRISDTYFYKAGNADVRAYRYSDNAASLGIGPSVRYTLASHLNLTASSLLQTDVNNAFDYYYLTTQLGIQYAFGR